MTRISALWRLDGFLDRDDRLSAEPSQGIEHGYNLRMKSATIGVRELRDGLSRHLAAVRDGGEITITDHGTPIARIIPIGGGRLEQLIAEGRVLPASDPDVALPRRQPIGPLSDLVER